MLKQIIFYALLLFSITAFADDVQLAHDTKISDFQATIPDNQKNVTLTAPITESLGGCKVAQGVRVKPFYDENNPYECLGKDNIYNNQNAEILNEGFDMFMVPFLIITGYLIYKISLMTLLKNSTGLIQQVGAASITFIGGILAILYIPFFETDIPKTNPTNPEEQTYHMTTARYLSYAIKDWSNASGDYFNYLNGKSDKLVFPATQIPNPSNKGFQIGRNLIEFSYCAAREPKDQELKIGVYFSDITGSFVGSAQVGGCAVEITAAVDPMIQGHAKVPKFDYNKYVGQQFGIALQAAMSRANAVGNNIASVPEKLANTAPQTYDHANLERGNEAAYNLTNFDAGGISEYARDSAHNIGEDFIYEMTKYPGIAMSTVPGVNRSVQLCRNVQGGTSYFDMNIGIKENLDQCVAAMCVSESSPGICGEAIEYHNFLVNDNSILFSNNLTMLGRFFTMTYETDSYKRPAQYFVDSINVRAYYNNADSANLENRMGDKAFELVIHKKSYPRVDATVEDSPFAGFADSYNIGGGLEKAFMKMFETDDSGILGMNNFYDCIAHPNSIRPNGWICRSVLNTIQALGHNFQKVGIGMISGATLNNLQTPSLMKKSKITAAVRSGAQSMADGVSAIGSSALVIKYAATFAANEYVNDTYGNYGGTFTNEDVILLSAAYLDPVFNKFVMALGKILVAMGYFLTLGIPIMLGTTFLSLFILMLITLLSELYFMGPFVKSLNKEEFYDETGFFQPFNNYAVIIASLFCIPVSFAVAFLFFDTLFAYNVISYESLMTFQNKTPQVTSMGDILGYMIASFLFVYTIYIIFSAIMKMAFKTQTILRVIILGDSSQDDTFGELEIKTKKELI